MTWPVRLPEETHFCVWCGNLMPTVLFRQAIFDRCPRCSRPLEDYSNDPETYAKRLPIWSKP